MKLKERFIFGGCLGILIVPFLWLHITEYQERQLDENERTIRFLQAPDHSDFNSIEHGHSLSRTRLKFRSNQELNNIDSNNNVNMDTKEDKSLHISKEKRSTENLNEKDDGDDDDDDEPDDPWLTWKEMVKLRQLTSSQPGGVNTILDGLSFKPIVAAGIGYKGTQLKATFLLDGKQKVVFKPMRYPRDYVIEGKPYDGYDRHNGEIAAFHVDRILGFNRAPPVAGRKVNLEDEVEPIAERSLLNTFFKKDGNTCFYGVCHYCNKEEAACANKTVMEGSLTIWLPRGWGLAKWRHPWQRTYTSKKAIWEVDNNHCKRVLKKYPYDEGPRLLDIIDTAIFDFIIGNADRHHYETLKKGDEDGVLVHLDNAKSFGNPKVDEISILAPLYQCCRQNR
ncbi:glycosaminoglycan xylosylkinase-like isoform X2 [Actinia tenebrosa]|uniref:Glycosaminoglycan xylosylkinase-like isoform X2 n=1 Tax=Actinia tenebrosa TaxID=6105 RepID=A0A6P8J402_ACTTE|nr:glycosaminoglycan xylosylkinase-like isoform X2 [Actinia tenebrosa]